jgi:hypothetical protein
MRELSASEILDVWERGRSTTLPERALDLLVAGGYAGQAESLAVGARDALLVDLRERLFGAAISAVGECPSCGELLEVELVADDLRAETAPEGILELAPVRLRLPTAGDLVAVAGAADVEEGRRLLLAECVEGELAPEHEQAVVERMAESDPGAWTEIALRCPACEHDWTAPFDIVSFLWTELEAWARRLVGDVHLLASAYGWPESAVLALSPARREAYLELVGG